MLLKWFLSRTVRTATDLRRHVLRLLNEQRDILTGEAVDAIFKSAQDLKTTIASREGNAVLQAQMTQLTEAANQWLMP